MTRTNPSPLVRRIVLKTHRVIGLAAGLIFLVLGLTGCLLVFEHELDEALNPDLFTVTPFGVHARLEAVLWPVEYARPGLGIARVVFPQRADQPFEVRLDDGTSAFVDPYSPRVIGWRSTTGHAVDRLLDLHVRLLAGPTGNLVVGIAGLVTLASAMSGLYLWWPGRIWRLRGTAGWRRLTFDLHQIVGFSTSAILVVIALSGSMMYFNEATQRVVRNTLSSGPPQPTPRRATPGTTADRTMTELVRLADAALPEARTTFVIPARGNQPVRVQKRFPEDPNPAGRSTIYLDPSTGEILQVVSTRERDLATAVLNSRRALHTGEIFGRPTQVVAFLASLALAVEAVTGFVMWLNRRRLGARGA